MTSPHPGFDARKLAVWLPLAGAALWIVLANLREVVNNDLFLHLRVGATVIDQMDIPSTDVFSATASGRSFTAHEWLSAVCFSTVDRAFGGAGLSILRVLISLGCAAFLVASATESQRRSPGFVLVLLVAMYVITLRAEVRPHMFTLLILCGYAFAIERWRRTGGWRPLVWLIPVQILWVNLHGAYLFGPVILGLLAGCIGLLAAFPALQHDSRRALTWADFKRVSLVAAGCLAASCINPYGPRILLFSIELSLESDYVRSVIAEWQSPLTNLSWRLRHSYWLIPFLAMIGIVWGGLLLRLRSRPLIDVAFAALVTFMAIRAMRFVPYVAIFGFGIAIRSWSTTRVIGPAIRKRGASVLRVCEVGLLLMFLVTTAARGFTISDRESYPIGVGYGGSLMPFEAVSFMQQRGMKGAVYNEYTDGAYLIYRLHPDVKPVMDSRIDIYGERLHREYIDSFSSRDKFYAYLDEYDVDLVLLRPGKRNAFSTLQRNPEWELVFADDSRFLFQRIRPDRF
jgi:hypothetical protein